MTGLRAITVCVDYQDLLGITLKYNAHHFEEVWVVTDAGSFNRVSAVAMETAFAGLTKVAVVPTQLFYKGGATFNKWAALEWGLDRMGRSGWLCVMDADVLWPKDATERMLNPFAWPAGGCLMSGSLYTPLRRMDETCKSLVRLGEPLFEAGWGAFPLHRQQREFAGYTQIFHADDPALGPAPWHQVDWAHAGGADSFFQAKWPEFRKVRPPFEVLHLGPAGVNWFGRSTPRLDGTVPAGASGRAQACRDIWPERRRREREGQDPFGGERVK